MALTATPVQASASLASITELSGYADGALVTGEIVFLFGVGYLTLNRASVATVDNINTFATNSGSGRWILLVSTVANPTISVATTALLTSSIEDAGLAQGATIYVASIQEYVTLDKTSTATAARIAFLTKSGTGRWIRQSRTTLGWVSQTTWYVDATNGNDDNSGATTLLPLQTVNELTKRLVSLIGGITYTVNLLSDIPKTDDATFDIQVIPNGASLIPTLTINGFRTLVRSGTVTAATQANYASNSACFATIQDGAISWASDIGSFIVSGTHGGWIVKDQGAGTARVNAWWNDSTRSTVVPATAPSAAAAYSVYSLSKWRPNIQGDFNCCTVIFNNINFDAPGCQGTTGLVAYRSVNSVNFFACKFSDEGVATEGGGISSVSRSLGASEDREFSLIQCLLRKTITDSFAMFLNGRMSITTGTCFLNIYIILGQRGFCLPWISSCLLQSSVMSVSISTVNNSSYIPRVHLGDFSSGLTANGLAIMDCNLITGSYGTINFGLYIGLGANVHSNGALVGNAGAGFYGVVINEGATLTTDQDVNPIVTGALGDFLCGDLTTHLPPLRTLTTFGGATAPVPVACTTWATWAASPFSRNVVADTNLSKIVLAKYS